MWDAACASDTFLLCSVRKAKNGYKTVVLQEGLNFNPALYWDSPLEGMQGIVSWLILVIRKEAKEGVKAAQHLAATLSKDLQHLLGQGGSSRKKEALAQLLKVVVLSCLANLLAPNVAKCSTVSSCCTPSFSLRNSAIHACGSLPHRSRLFRAATCIRRLQVHECRASLSAHPCWLRGL